MRRNKYPPRGSVTEFVNGVVLTWDSDECLLWPHSTVGYGYACYKMPGHTTSRLSRALCEINNGPPPTTSHQAAHRCGVNLCVNGRHLYWATPQQNSDDKARHGRMARGCAIGNSKITPRDVREMRSLSGKESLRSLATRFGVHEDTVWLAVRRKTWAWLP